MSQEVRQILDMLKEGKVTTEEAEKLIAAIQGGASSAAPEVNTAAKAQSKLKFLRIQIEGGDRDSKGSVNIRVPIQLLRSGMKLTSLMPAQARDKIQKAFDQKGLNLDISKMDADELIANLGGLSVDIAGQDEDGEGGTVRIFCE